MLPSDCSQVRRLLRSTQADAAGGQERRARGPSTGFPAVVAAGSGVAGGPGAGRLPVTVRCVPGPATGAGRGPGAATPRSGRAPSQRAAAVTVIPRAFSAVNQAAARRRPREMRAAAGMAGRFLGSDGKLSAPAFLGVAEYLHPGSEPAQLP